MRAAPLLLALLLAGIAGCSTSESSASASDSSASAPESSASTGTADSLAIELSDFMLEPASLTASGPTVTIDVTNAGPTPHNLSIRGSDGELIDATDDLSSGDAQTLSVELDPGEYVIFCGLAGHESLGMAGTLTVTASS